MENRDLFFKFSTIFKKNRVVSCIMQTQYFSQFHSGYEANRLTHNTYDVLPNFHWLDIVSLYFYVRVVCSFLRNLLIFNFIPQSFYMVRN